MPTEIRAHVLLRPEKDSDELLRCPSGVTIQLKKRKGPRANSLPAQKIRTLAEGVTEAAQLTEGTYTVKVTDPGFDQWSASDLVVPPDSENPEADAEDLMRDVADAVDLTAEDAEAAALTLAIAAAEAGELPRILLTPKAERRLVLAKFATEDGQPITIGTLHVSGPGIDLAFPPCSDGIIYAVAPKKLVTLTLASINVRGQLRCPQNFTVPYQVTDTIKVQPIEFIYWPAVHIVAAPVVSVPGEGKVPLLGTTVAVRYQAGTGGDAVIGTKIMNEGAEVSFDYPFPGWFTISLTPPESYKGVPIKPNPDQEPQELQAGLYEVPNTVFEVEQDPTIAVQVLLSAQQGSGQSRRCPPGVEVVLTKENGGEATLLDLGETDVNGVTEPITLAAATYQAQITNPGFTLWGTGEFTVESDDTASGKTVTKTVILAPDNDCRLVPVRLITDMGAQIPGGAVTIAKPDGSFTHTFTPSADGMTYAVSPEGEVTLQFTPVEIDGQWYSTRASEVLHAVTKDPVRSLEFVYFEMIQVVAKPTVRRPGGDTATLTGAIVTVEYLGSVGPGGALDTKTLANDQNAVSFDYVRPGPYMITITPPATFEKLPVTGQKYVETAVLAPSKDPFTVTAEFAVVPTEEAEITVETPGAEHLLEDLHLEIYDEKGSIPGISFQVNGQSREASVPIPSGVPFAIRLAEKFTPRIKIAQGTSPQPEEIPLQMTQSQQSVKAGSNQIKLEYAHSINIHAVDADEQPVPGAVIDVFYEHEPRPIKTVVTGQHGHFHLAVRRGGTYFLAAHTTDGEPDIRERIEVHSNGVARVHVGARRDRGGGDGRGGGRGGDGRGGVTDLSAYPVLTEEVSTIGPPAPAPGGPGAGGPGPGYGQTVDQVMRDVLGWRPSGGVAGFEAALTGAFQLKEVEGHTEWTWQQRGYAVQADMGALTGAQASIYARAKAALDQIKPLLAGITPLNPTLYPPQDLEAIRTVITAELQELVSELAWPAGPRIQRVNELFSLLTGESSRSTDANPDHVQGQLGTMRDRFGLTVDWVDTVEEEFILTNFRVVVEQVLTLKESWTYDRKLLSKLDVDTSFGTILIWLSRGLEAVCESVDDLTFAMDSVYVDAAQRQVIELNLPGQSPILLSDLLDWVTRAGREEGPRIIQDAGKDGVLAFAPVLRNLRELVTATRALVRGPRGAVLPDGLRTPRVDRAFQVLTAQLDKATDLADLVRRYDQPEITSATVSGPDGGQITITIGGTNFRRGVSAVLMPGNREDLADLPARYTTFNNSSSVTAGFRDPGRVPNSQDVTWQVMLTNEDGQRSNQVAI